MMLFTFDKSTRLSKDCSCLKLVDLPLAFPFMPVICIPMLLQPSIVTFLMSSRPLERAISIAPLLVAIKARRKKRRQTLGTQERVEHLKLFDMIL